MSVQRHEQAFGVLETDVQKRVIGDRGGAGAGAGLVATFERSPMSDWSLK